MSFADISMSLAPDHHHHHHHRVSLHSQPDVGIFVRLLDDKFSLAFPATIAAA